VQRQAARVKSTCTNSRRSVRSRVACTSCHVSGHFCTVNPKLGNVGDGIPHFPGLGPYTSMARPSGSTRNPPTPPPPNDREVKGTYNITRSLTTFFKLNEPLVRFLHTFRIWFRIHKHIRIQSCFPIVKRKGKCRLSAFRYN
jgi:hypothetical protein